MIIYVVTSGAYSDYHIDAVFTDKELAKRYCAAHNSNNYPSWVEEYETDAVKVEGEEYVHHLFVINERDTGPRSYENVYRLSPNNRNEIVCEGIHINARVYLTKDDPALAFKIGKDMIAKYKAEKEGL
jgi:hypothetical protein